MMPAETYSLTPGVDAVRAFDGVSALTWRPYPRRITTQHSVHEVAEAGKKAQPGGEVRNGHHRYIVFHDLSPKIRIGANAKQLDQPLCSTQALHQPAPATCLPGKMAQGPHSASALPVYNRQFAQLASALGET